jgi:hypothetical protein
LTRFLDANRYPLRAKTLCVSLFGGRARLVLGQYCECRRQWQAAARYRRIAAIWNGSGKRRETAQLRGLAAG